MPKELSDPKYLEAHPEAKEQADKISKEIDEALARLKSDKELNIIFARQDYEIKSGAELGMDPNKQYLYLDFSDDLWDLAEKKLKNAVKSIQRLDQESEKKVIAAIEEERTRSEEGFGLLFG